MGGYYSSSAVRREDFDYAVPRELIAQEPAAERDASRMLVLHRATGRTEHRAFRDLAQYLRREDVLVINDTKVFPARLVGRRPTGAKVEALLVEPLGVTRWRVLLDTPRKLEPGDTLEFSGTRATIVGKNPWVLEFGEDIRPKLPEIGVPPLPPYIKREAKKSDFERYQTVYARREGSIAAPTAGLHFTPRVLESLPCRVVRITLHVGVGTFKPIKAETIEEHRMDPERYEVSPEVWDAVRGAGRVVAVGTTSVRALETAARTGKLSGESDLFIYPGFEFKVVGAMLTNFHLPRGTPLLLVCAFAGKENIFAAYQEAIRERYRFFSYGDAMLIV